MSLARGADLLPAPPRAALAMPLPPDPLTAINLDDLLDAIGAAGWARPLLRPWLRPQARRFARVVREFDDRVGRHGLAAGGEWLVRRMAGGLQVTGRERIPARGPLLVLANHPGMTDTVALFAALAARPDLRVIAQDKPFLRALPHVVRQMIFLPEDGAGRTRVLRAGARHLQAGGVDPTAMRAVSDGQYHPVASNDTPEGRAKNRNVSLLLKPAGGNDTAG